MFGSTTRCCKRESEQRACPLIPHAAARQVACRSSHDGRAVLYDCLLSHAHAWPDSCGNKVSHSHSMLHRYHSTSQLDFVFPRENSRESSFARVAKEQFKAALRSCCSGLLPTRPNPSHTFQQNRRGQHGWAPGSPSCRGHKRARRDCCPHRPVVHVGAHRTGRGCSRGRPRGILTGRRRLQRHSPHGKAMQVHISLTPR